MESLKSWLFTNQLLILQIIFTTKPLTWLFLSFPNTLQLTICGVCVISSIPVGYIIFKKLKQGFLLQILFFIQTVINLEGGLLLFHEKNEFFFSYTLLVFPFILLSEPLIEKHKWKIALLVKLLFFAYLITRSVILCQSIVQRINLFLTFFGLFLIFQRKDKSGNKQVSNPNFDLNIKDRTSNLFINLAIKEENSQQQNLQDLSQKISKSPIQGRDQSSVLQIPKNSDLRQFNSPINTERNKISTNLRGNESGGKASFQCINNVSNNENSVLRLRNISQQFTAQQQNQKSLDLYEQTLNLFSQGILIMDSKEEIYLANENAQTILNCNEQNISKKIKFLFNRLLKEQYKNRSIKLKNKELEKCQFICEDKITLSFFHYAFKQSMLDANELDILNLLLNPQKEEYQQLIKDVENSAQGGSSKNILCSVLLDLQHLNYNLYFQVDYKTQNITKKLSIEIIQGAFIQDKEKMLFTDKRGKNADDNMLMIIIDDITQKFQLTELERKIKFENDILQSFSHELKTPLNGALGILSGVQDRVDPELKPQIQQAYYCNILLDYQIKNILDLQQFKKKRFSYEPEYFQIHSVTDEIKQIFTQMCEFKKIKLSIELDKSVGDIEIYQDKQRIQQILVNLITNSVKFTQTNGVISIQIQKKRNYDLTYFKFIVKDNGPGISVEKLQILQEHFEKDNKSQKNLIDFIELNEKYYGLGLKISNKILKDMMHSSHKKNKNQLSITKLEKGIQFDFKIADFRTLQQQQQNIKSLSIQFFSQNNNSKLFPLYQSSQTESENQFCDSPTDYIHDPYQGKVVQTKKALQQNFKIKKTNCQNCKAILIVDDEPFNHTSIKMMLQGLNYHFDQVYNGEEAVQAVKTKYKNKCCENNRYEYILMDLAMPIKDGFLASEEIIEFFEEKNSYLKSDNRIIICSAYDTFVNKQKAKQLGIKHFLAKPLKRKDFLFIMSKDGSESRGLATTL